MGIRNVWNDLFSIQGIVTVTILYLFIQNIWYTGK
jgi:hypothetical protein